MSKQRASARDWIAVAAGTIGSFMALLDISIVNAALPTIQGEIGASGTEGTWVATSYLVAEIVMIPLSPFLVRLFGLRNFLLGAAVSFTGFSVVCGISTTLPMMIAGRVGQGFTGGALIPTAMTIIATRLPPHQQPIGTAAFGGTAILGPVLGPIIGGWLTDNYSWHYAFFLNVPVCAGLVLLLLLGLDHERLRLDQLRRADWLGIAGLMIGLSSLTIMLEEGQREMWFESPVIVKLAIATVFGFALIAIGQVHSAHPVLKLRLIFSRAFGSVFVLSLVIGVVLYGVTFLIPQFLSVMADYSALQSGKVVFVSGIPALLMMPFLPLAFKYLDVRVAVLFGMSLVGVSCAMDWNLTAQSAGGDLTNSQLVRGFGQIFAMMFLNQAAISAVSPDDAGDASALFNAGRNLGGSIGLALMATLQDRQTFIHFNRLAETVSANAVTTQQWFARAMEGPAGEAGAYRQLAGQMLQQATVMAYNDLFFALGVAIAITTPLALFLRPISSGTQMAMH
ncbi:MFS transporter, DHA2 family, multidrug resistance protein [Sphingomonas aurantiaca]|uniref:MFS transporter, DHA2 family, multidrug resistance protein n=1 Tax=Sphingomonas aurantiaca TaxID=185949 RepID=A0A5E8APF4_9SPHN|nr:MULTISPECIES: DHA2 family efflux MFS transporter permease subunit [Sphingomonas]RUN75464.1 DHA2 family efflux MFS transporter permease subunit [Sphingomonas sp. TF3]VVT31417.1 MFS transporter, DHA2 family, multidrug resistance protein [Sphingomonas aurantiaca]